MRPEFAVHMLNERGKGKAVHIMNAFDFLLADLEGIMGMPSREMSLVQTKLEEAAFFAKKAMAVQSANQQ